MRVLFVCLGNICRSPMAHGLMEEKLRRAGVAGVAVDSCGTGAWHAGELADPRTRAVLAKHNVGLDHRARQLRDDDFERFDLLLAMDRANLRDMTRRCPAEHVDKLHLTLAPIDRVDVPDPYYGGPSGFDDVYAMLDEALEHWVSQVQSSLP
ncbi:MAG: low molecular weight phosphotyrosine protein phosphatase [Proteobacteria bacterium]|nr:low molecular weight phosphotyrosine protein phosphatase [Pseudomonadota bacterium]